MEDVEIIDTVLMKECNYSEKDFKKAIKKNPIGYADKKILMQSAVLLARKDEHDKQSNDFNLWLKNELEKKDNNRLNKLFSDYSEKFPQLCIHGKNHSAKAQYCENCIDDIYQSSRKDVEVRVKNNLTKVRWHAEKKTLREVFELLENSGTIPKEESIIKGVELCKSLRESNENVEAVEAIEGFITVFKQQRANFNQLKEKFKVEK